MPLVGRFESVTASVDFYKITDIPAAIILAAAHPTLSRVDLVCYRDPNCELRVITGTPAATPVTPHVPAGFIVLSVIQVKPLRFVVD